MCPGCLQIRCKPDSRRDHEVESGGDFDPERAARTAHQWVGAAGLLGLPEISEKARSLAAALRARPLDMGELRQALDAMLSALAARLAEQPLPK